VQVGGSLPGGLMLRGLFGGERRRLSIAAGILAAPAVLFLDEPTSGLDSFAALSVMGHLQGMARGSGRIIISTIHQPRSAIWEMFDRVSSRDSACLQVGCQRSTPRWYCCSPVVTLLDASPAAAVTSHHPYTWAADRAKPGSNSVQG
jgi:energy-coupling factor transporter ATP-binding protein EcfA2